MSVHVLQSIYLPVTWVPISGLVWLPKCLDTFSKSASVCLQTCHQGLEQSTYKAIFHKIDLYESTSQCFFIWIFFINLLHYKCLLQLKLKIQYNISDDIVFVYLNHVKVKFKPGILDNKALYFVCYVSSVTGHNMTCNYNNPPPPKPFEFCWEGYDNLKKTV